MSHKHHSCSCPHESVKFCSTCKLVHCEGCNMEWVTKTANTWGYNYGQYLGTGTLTYPNGVRSISTGDIKTIPVTYTAAATTEPVSTAITYKPTLDEMAKLKEAFCDHKGVK